MNELKVIVVVRGGVAEVLEAPEEVGVWIMDFDNDQRDCISCGKEIADSETCPYCGTDQDIHDLE